MPDQAPDSAIDFYGSAFCREVLDAAHPTPFSKERTFRLLMRRLCDRLRGNRRVLRPMQQMRLPGGVHEKTGERAALVLAGERYYRARQVADAIALSREENEGHFEE